MHLDMEHVLFATLFLVGLLVAAFAPNRCSRCKGTGFICVQCGRCSLECPCRHFIATPCCQESR